MKKLSLVLLGLALFGAPAAQAQKVKTKTKGGAAMLAAGHDVRWPADKANAWYKARPWMTGANFIPSTAINQLEMWQAATFDPATIDKELGYAEGIGFNTMRVFPAQPGLEGGPGGLQKSGMNDYLALADKHHLGTIFVFFDDCWNKDPQNGDPARAQNRHPQLGLGAGPRRPGLARLGHIRCSCGPTSRTCSPALPTISALRSGTYITSPATRARAMPPCPWCAIRLPGPRPCAPTSPLSMGLWNLDFRAFNTYQALHSDVITYHNYDEVPAHQREIELLETHGRPLICTEYMARPRNSRFVNILPLLKKYNVAAINWGLVAGKTNTKYAWDTPLADGSEPSEWFHEVSFAQTARLTAGTKPT